jgi:Four helix bundle sensory module for signal transduction
MQGKDPETKATETQSKGLSRAVCCSASFRARFGVSYWIALMMLSLGPTIGCDVNTALDRVSQARHISADLLVQFTKAADAANRAVMADTDEASVAFAREAEQAKEKLQTDIDTLRPLLASLNYADEGRLLQEFVNRFAEYRELDRRILDLAVENTNLKAQRLSFGPAQEAADSFRDSLRSVAPLVPADKWRVEALVATAVATVREIQVLQAPHIADADEAVMTRMEKSMATSEAAARNALKTLLSLVDPKSQARIAAAKGALDRFMAINQQIISLSRRNTNVRSLALSLNEKRKVTGECETSLHGLRDALSKRGFTGTR